MSAVGAARAPAAALLLTLAIAGGMLALTSPTGAAADPALELALVGTAVAGVVAWIAGRRTPAVAGILVAVALAVVRGGGVAAVAIAPLAVVIGAGAAGLPRRLLAAVVVPAAIAAAGGALLYDPFLDPTCAGCGANALALAHRPALADALHGGGAVAAGLVLVLATLVPTWHRLPLAVLAGLAAAAPWWQRAAVIAAVVTAAVIATDAAADLATRRRIERLVAALRDAPDARAVLRRGVGDPTLELAYRLDGEERAVGRDGGAAPVAAADQRTTLLTTAGRVVAEVYHRPGSLEVERLAEALDAPARLALENERLGAELAARAAELRASRRRIVERGDAERCRLERDVHDGAQQHALALGFDLRVTLAALADDDPAEAALLAAMERTRAALDGLRDVAHGISPPSLDAAGLAPALRLFAQDARVPLELAAVAPTRFDPAVERTAFLLVADAATGADGPLGVAVAIAGDAVRITVDGATAAPRRELLDRIAALDGTVDVEDARIVAVIPCA